MTATLHAPLATRSDPRRWWALAVLAASLLVVVMDITILNVALPEMSEELGLSSVSGLSMMSWSVCMGTGPCGGLGNAERPESRDAL